MKRDDFYEEDTFEDEISYEDDEEYDDFDEESGGLQVLVRVLGVLVAVAILVVVGILVWQRGKLREADDTEADEVTELDFDTDTEEGEIVDLQLVQSDGESSSGENSGGAGEQNAAIASPTATPAPTQAPSPTPTIEATAEPTATAEATRSPEPTAVPMNTPTEKGTATQTAADLVFTDVNETVTAKDRTNLRDKPSQGNDSNVIYVLSNGETVQRTGVSDSGWSRLSYDGKTCYAVSSYLTTDLSAKPTQAPEENDGLNTKFTKVDEQVTPKIEVNLRKLPSVTNPDAEVVATVQKGTALHRTGINTDVGWSRISYDGQTLYCISSYVEAYTE